MTLQLVILIGIVAAALVVFIGGWVRVDIVGLLVLSALTLTGLVTAQEALAGFSSPAVVTVWAMFILSAGLTRTGIAQLLGQPLQRFAGRSEGVLIAVLMLAASLLSALINTVTVAAILLPSTMELARHSRRSPTRLLMPLALGCLLGGPFTAISTPPNILVTDALKTAGLEPFSLFAFTPITAVVVLVGIAFMVLVGRRLLPVQTAAAGTDVEREFCASYQLDAYLFTVRIPMKSPLDGRSLAASRIGSALYLTVLALQRRGVLMLAPGPGDILRAGDTLFVHGRRDHLERLHANQHLQVVASEQIDGLFLDRLRVAEAVIAEGSPLVGSTLTESGLRREHRVHVMALHCPVDGEVKDLRRHRLMVGERLLLQGEQEALAALAALNLVTELRIMSPEEVKPQAGDTMQLLSVRVPPGSVLADRDLLESRLGNGFGLTVVALLRDEVVKYMPSPREKVEPGDVLVLQGSPRDLEVLDGLQDLQIAEQEPGLLAELESQQVGGTEVLLSPRTTLAGRTLSELLFRERYGLNVLAVWRKGRAFRSNLQDTPLQFGDALLVYGPRRRLEAMARDPDFIVLNKAAARAPRLEKARIATVIMLAVLLSALTGLVPIAVAALTGAALMVLLGCLSMDEAYRAIEWKVVFLIAGMLPLGAAIEKTGAAQMAAQALIDMVGGYGPRWIVAALFTVTVIGTQIIPTAALVVLMTPVALNAANSLGISPYLLMMTVAIAASASFAGPLSHPAHLLVMSPGGYRFMDYVKVGVPLTILTLIVSVGLLPILWAP